MNNRISNEKAMEAAISVWMEENGYFNSNKKINCDSFNGLIFLSLIACIQINTFYLYQKFNLQ